MFPDNINVSEDKKAQTKWRIDLKLDGQQYVYLTVDLARDLWHDLGAVLQAYDHDHEAEDVAIDSQA